MSAAPFNISHVQSFKETEEVVHQEAIPVTNPPPLPDETIMPPPPTAGDEFKQFQDLFKWMADMLQMPLEEVTDSQHKLFDILRTSTSSKISVPI